MNTRSWFWVWLVGLFGVCLFTKLTSTQAIVYLGQYTEFQPCSVIHNSCDSAAVLLCSCFCFLMHISTFKMYFLLFNDLELGQSVFRSMFQSVQNMFCLYKYIFSSFNLKCSLGGKKKERRSL